MIFRRAAQQVAEIRANTGAPFGDSTPPPPGLDGGAFGAGIPVTQRSATTITAVWGSCSLIASSVASLPTVLRDGPSKATSNVLPASPLMERPYAEISRSDWWRQFIWGLALRGNFFGLIIERDADGYPKQIKPISNDAVGVRRNQDGDIEYRFYGKLVNDNRNVFHVRYQSQPGDIVGMSPMEACAGALGRAIAQSRYAESFYTNSANPNGIIQVPGVLDYVETRKMQRGWIAAHQGLNNANMPAVLTEGAEFKPISMSPADSKLIEAMGWSAQEISGMIFRIPAHMVGMQERSSSFGRGIEFQERSFFTNTLVDYLAVGAEAMTDVLPPGRFMSFDTSERLRGTALERAQTASLMMLAGAWCADDSRSTFDMPPLPDGLGESTFVPINTELLEQALEALAASEEELPEGQDGSEVPSGPVPSGSGGSDAVTRALTRALERRNASERSRIDWERRTALAEAQKPSQTINVQPSVNVSPHTSISQPPAEVHIRQEAQEPPSVTVEGSRVEVSPELRITQPAPEVTVNTPEVRNEINVPEQKLPEIRFEPNFSPDVHVEVPEQAAPEVRIDVAAPDVTVNPEIRSPRPSGVIHERDEQGRIVKTVYQYEDEEND